MEAIEARNRALVLVTGHAVRWANNMLSEVVSNYKAVLTEETKNHIKQAMTHLVAAMQALDVQALGISQSDKAARVGNEVRSNERDVRG